MTEQIVLQLPNININWATVSEYLIKGSAFMFWALILSMVSLRGAQAADTDEEMIGHLFPGVPYLAFCIPGFRTLQKIEEQGDDSQ